MHLTVTPRPGASVVAVDGEFLGVLQGPPFRDAIAAVQRSGQHRVVLDLRGCSLMDSAGLGVLIDAAAVLRDRGGDMRVAAREGRLRRLFTMTGLLGRVFAVYTTVDEAMDGWGQPEEA